MLRKKPYSQKRSIHKRLYSGLFIAILSVQLTGCGNETDKVVLSVTGGDFTRVVSSISKESNQISSDVLTRWQAEGRQDLLLVDLRSQHDYALGHIEGSENIPFPLLFEELSKRNLRKGDRIVLYSDSSVDGAKATVLLRLGGHDARFLEGGFDQWQAYMFNSAVPAQQASEAVVRPLSQEQRQVLACSYCESNPASFRPPVKAIEVTTPKAFDVQAAESNTQKNQAKKKSAREKAADEGC